MNATFWKKMFTTNLRKQQPNNESRIFFFKLFITFVLSRTQVPTLVFLYRFLKPAYECNSKVYVHLC